MIRGLIRFFQREGKVEPDMPSIVEATVPVKSESGVKKRKKSKSKNGFGKTEAATFLKEALVDLFTLRLTTLTREEFSNLCEFAGVLDDAGKKEARQYFAGKGILRSRGSGYYIAGDYGSRAPRNSIRKWRGMQLWGVKQWGLQQHFYTPREITGKLRVVYDNEGKLYETLPGGEVAAMMNTAGQQILLEQKGESTLPVLALKKIAPESIEAINAETGLELQTSTLNDYFERFGLSPEEWFVEVPAASPAHLLNATFVSGVEKIKRGDETLQGKSTAIDALFTSITGEALPKHRAFLMAKDEKNGLLSGPGMELVSKAAREVSKSHPKSSINGKQTQGVRGPSLSRV